MSTQLFIVNRLHPGLYEDLHRRFADDASVTVILDRRLAARRRRVAPAAAERRRAERRSRPDVDEQLRLSSYAIVSPMPGAPTLHAAREWVEMVQGYVTAIRAALDAHDRLQREAEAIKRLRAEVDRATRELDEIDSGLARTIAIANDLLARLRGGPTQGRTG